MSFQFYFFQSKHYFGMCWVSRSIGRRVLNRGVPRDFASLPRPRAHGILTLILPAVVLMQRRDAKQKSWTPTQIKLHTWESFQTPLNSGLGISVICPDIPSLKLMAKAPENRPFAPKGSRIVFQPSIFRR